MKMQFSKNRIAKTFLGYAIIILIPMGFLILQEVTFLTKDKNRIERRVLTQLQKVGERFNDRLFRQWSSLKENHTRYDFDYYLPKPLPQGDGFGSSAASVQDDLSLGDSIKNLARLDLNAEYTPPTADERLASSIDPDDFLERSIVGYFHYDPQNHKITSPYRGGGASLEASSGSQEIIARYNAFLENRVAPFLFNSLDLDQDNPVRPSELRNQLKVRNLTSSYRQIDEFQAFDELYQELGRDGQETVRVQTCDMSHRYFPDAHEKGKSKNVDFLISFRAIIIDSKRIFLQGVLINLALFRIEAQAQMAAYQPEMGQVIIAPPIPGMDSHPLDHPFNNLHCNYDLGSPDIYLATWHHHKNRLFFIIGALLLIVGGTLAHLGRLIHANIF